MVDRDRKRVKRIQKKKDSARRIEQRRQHDAANLAIRTRLERERQIYGPMFEEMIRRPDFTTPTGIVENVRVFCESLSDQTPYFLDCEPELWCRQSMCTLNVRKYIEVHGGAAQCGFRIWYNGRDYAEAERHVIWVNGDLRRDVSFSVDGEKSVLFLPDRLERQFDFEAMPRVTRRAFTESSRRALKWHEECWALVEQDMVQFSDEEGWESMPTYEAWLAGKRASNFVMKTVPRA